MRPSAAAFGSGYDEVMEDRPSPKNAESVTRTLEKDEIESSLDISASAFQRQAVSRGEGAMAESGIDPIIERAAEVIGDRQKAMHWLGTPVRGLDFATPISLLATVEGQMRVKDILGQMEHGIW